MKKNYLSLLLALAVAPVMDAAGTHFESLKNSQPRIAVMGANAPSTLSVSSEALGLKTSQLIQDPVARQEATLWGALEAPNDMTWMYNQTIEYGEYIKSSEITIFDETHTEVGKISITLPDDVKINKILPFGAVTKKMFDNNDKTYEVPVFFHQILKPGEMLNWTVIYDMQGNEVRRYQSSNVIYYNYAKSEYDNQSQLVLVDHEEYDADEDKTYTYVDVYVPMGWGDTEPQIKHTFKVDTELINYSDGPYINITTIDGKPYFILSHYEKPYMNGYDANWDPIATPDNKYVLEVYNSNYELVETVKVPLIPAEKATYRFAAFGVFSDSDISKNYFDNSGELKYVITYSDYYIADDSYHYSFDVYNGKSEFEKNIFAEVLGTYFKLSDIEGQEDQYAFLCEENGSTAVQTVNLPSCEKGTKIPSRIGGVKMSTTLDRYPKGDSYQYAIGVAEGQVHPNGDVISSIGWYNPDLTLDHFTNFNIGPKGMLFTPLITSESLNPYIFDTDADHDYIFIAKIQRENSDILDNVLYIAHENGDVIATFKGNEEIGDLFTSSFLNYNSKNPELVVSFYNNDTDKYDVNYYSLPFFKFSRGGDGTEANPYLISTIGDMKQIASELGASYKLANNIDMSEIGNWEPVQGFTGNFDGAHNKLTGLTINSKDYSTGLFGTTTGAKIHDFVIVEPNITVDGDNNYVGVIAGQAQETKISNIHIYNAVINDPTADARCTVGGVVAQASNFSTIENCSFVDGDINVEGGDKVGGIVGSARTSTEIKGCAVFGDITINANSAVGGIAGETSTASTVTDCHANASIVGMHTLGGIVGDNTARALIDRCIAEGSITSPGVMWGGVKIGGIVGVIAPDWEELGGTVVSNCVSNVNITCPVTEADPESGIEADETYHRIAGKTIANEYFEDGQEPLVEKGLVANYALATATINDSAIESDDATSVQGASVELADLNEDFFKELGYAIGSIGDKKIWVATSELPILFIESDAFSGIENVITPEDNTITISQNAGSFVADGAVKMMIYSTNGQVMASVNGANLSIAELNAGVYVVVAIDANGNAHSMKVLVK